MVAVIDGWGNVIHPKDGDKAECIAVAGASAIQRLVSERDDLRVRVNAQH